MKYPKPLIYRQLTKAEVAKIKEDLPLSQENLGIINLIFTSKKTITELANLVARSQESLNVLRQRAWAKFIEYRPKPEGWISPRSYKAIFLSDPPASYNCRRGQSLG